MVHHCHCMSLLHLEDSRTLELQLDANGGWIWVKPQSHQQLEDEDPQEIPRYPKKSQETILFMFCHPKYPHMWALSCMKIICTIKLQKLGCAEHRQKAYLHGLNKTSQHLHNCHNSE